MLTVWKYIAPLVKGHRLKGMFMEVSYSNAQPEKQLFGHLTPKLFFREMKVLALLAGAENMKNLTVAITHIKPTPGAEKQIKADLSRSNVLGLQLVYPVQGKLMTF